MPIVSAICPSCAAPLEVDNTNEAGICKYCGNAFIIEKAINNYNIKYEVKADNVIINNKPTMKGLLDREEVFLRLGETEKLEALYEEMVQEYPKRYEGWWGKILLLTERFGNPVADLEQVNTWFGFVRDAAPSDMMTALENQYTGYLLSRKQFEYSVLEHAHNSNADKLRNDITKQAKASKAYAVKSVIRLIFYILLEGSALFGVRTCIKKIKDLYDTSGVESSGVLVFLIVAIGFIALALIILFFKNLQFPSIFSSKQKKKLYEKQLSEEEQKFKAESDVLNKEMSDIQAKINAL